MALTIVAGCVSCHACLSLCPQQAIVAARPHFLILREKCDECAGDYPAAQCASICPVEGAILDALGQVVNPPGSLTGFAPECWSAVRAEIAAR